MFHTFESIAQIWLNALEGYSEEQLLHKPSEMEWSIGQVYRHILGAGQGFFMKNVKMCIRGEGEEGGEGMNDRGKGIFALGGFPDQRFGMPAPVAQQPPQPESKEALRENLLTQIAKMRELANEMEGYSPDVRTKHPIFGAMNAGEWYIMNGWHFAHHLRQKARLDEMI